MVESNNSEVLFENTLESETVLHLFQGWSSTSISCDSTYSLDSLEWSLRSYDYSTLPKNILTNIFSFLTEIEICQCVLRVCRSWRKVAKDPRLWNKLSFSNDEPSVSIICRLLRNSPKLEYLKLNFMSNVKTIIRQVCRCNKHIKYLAIRFCSEDEILPESVLRNVLISCTQMHTLDLKGTQFYVKRFYENVSVCKNLRSINLSDNSTVRVHDLFTIVLNCHTLEELKVIHRINKKKSLIITNEDAVFLFTNLESTLKVLKMDCTEFKQSGYESLLKCSKLEQLCLINAMSLPNTLFRNIWGYLPSLKSFKLVKATQIVSGDFVHLFTNGIDVMRNVTVIDVTDSWKLTDRGLGAIAKCCKLNLHKLILTNCKKIENLTTVLCECTNLRYLNIAHCNQLNISNIRAIPTYLTHLETLITDVHDGNYSIIKSISSNESIKIFISLSEYNKDKQLFYG